MADVETLNPAFYLAGGYSRLESHGRVARAIEMLCRWRCNSFWLTGNLDGRRDCEIAGRDRADCDEADALVVVSGPLDRGSTWVEMGMALGRRKPVILLGGRSGFVGDAPVFWALPECIAASLTRTGVSLQHCSGDFPEWKGPRDLLGAAVQAYRAEMYASRWMDDPPVVRLRRGRAGS